MSASVGGLRRVAGSGDGYTYHSVTISRRPIDAWLTRAAENNGSMAVRGVAYPAAVVLATVFFFAGASKLMDPRATGASLRALAVPAAAMTARMLPLVELTVAVALLVVPVVGGVLALGALSAFSAVLAARIRGGSTAPCGCFGSTAQEPASSVELLRNGLLAALAVTALFAYGPGYPTLEAMVTVSALTIAGTITVSLSRLRQQVGAVWSNREAREGALP